MSKQILSKELRYIDFQKNQFSFYDISVTSVGYNKMRISVTEGIIGTKGKTKDTYFEGEEDVFKQTLKIAYNWIYEKKNEGFLSLEKVKKAFSKKNPYMADKKKSNELINLVKLDFDEHNFRFYQLEFLSLGRNDLQVISSYGKLGSTGRSQVKRFEKDEQAFSKAVHFRNQKIHEKKGEGYLTKEQAISILSKLLEEEQAGKETPKKKEASVKKRVAFGYDCDKCHKTIPPSTYEKINRWARGQGNWDADVTHKHKVYCLDCQFDLDIFQKRLVLKTKK